MYMELRVSCRHEFDIMLSSKATRDKILHALRMSRSVLMQHIYTITVKYTYWTCMNNCKY